MKDNENSNHDNSTEGDVSQRLGSPIEANETNLPVAPNVSAISDQSQYKKKICAFYSQGTCR